MKIIGRINDVATRLSCKASVGREYPFSILKEENWHKRDDESEYIGNMVEVYSNVPVVYMDKIKYENIANTLMDLPEELFTLDVCGAWQAGYIRDKDAESGKIYKPKDAKLNEKFNFPLFIATDGGDSIIVHTGGGCKYPVFKGYITKIKSKEIKKLII